MSLRGWKAVQLAQQSGGEAEEGYTIEAATLKTLEQVAKGIAATFGSSCEVVIHDVGAKHPEHSIVAIENGHVTGRKVGDGASHVVLEQVRQADAQPSDHLSYLTRTPDGKILKSSTMYIRGRSGKVTAILGINYDISSLLMVEGAVHELIDTEDRTQSGPSAFSARTGHFSSPNPATRSPNTSAYPNIRFILILTNNRRRSKPWARSI